MAEPNPQPGRIVADSPHVPPHVHARTFSNAVVFHELTCAAERFQLISRKLWFVFYMLGSLQILILTFTTFLRVQHREDEVPKSILLLLDTTASFLSLAVIFVPFAATAKSCDRAYSLAAAFALSGAPVPVQVVTYIMETTTLCLKHPLAYRDCQFRDPYYGYVDPREAKTESIEMATL